MGKVVFKEYSDEFVMQVNEIYHDAEGKEYESKHPEIFQDEAHRWEEIGRSLIRRREGGVRILDIGSGTGFVPLTIAGFLKKEDLFVCSDISENILNVCKCNVMSRGFPCGFEFIKLQGKEMPFESKGFDFITLNSVLHHIPNLGDFFGEANRLLSPEGLMIIGHEPNRPFYGHPLLWSNYRVLSLFFDPAGTAYNLLGRLRLLGLAKRIYRKEKPEKALFHRVNERLMEEGLISSSLTPPEIIAIVDIHSPTAGGFHRERGIDIKEVLNEYLKNYEMVLFETYSHLSTLSSKNRLLSAYDSFLRKKCPQLGSTFLAVLRKLP